jgi:hypothetical protein
VRRLYLIASLAGCFRPAPSPGAPCTDRLQCPDGLVCDTGSVPPLCVVTLPDAAPPLPEGPPPAAGITWLEVATGSLDNTMLSQVTTAAPIGAAPGDLFLAFVSVKPPHGVSAVTGLDLQWTRLRQQCGGRNTERVALFWATGPMPRAGAVKVELNGGTAFLGSSVLSVHRYSGADPLQPVGNLSFANTNGADGGALCSGGTDTLTYDWSTLATTLPGAVVVSGVHTSNYTHDPGAGFTERSDVQSGNNSISAGMAVQDQTIAAPSPGVTISGSFVGGAPDWAAVAVELRPAL